MDLSLPFVVDHDLYRMESSANECVPVAPVPRGFAKMTIVPTGNSLLDNAILVGCARISMALILPLAALLWSLTYSPLRADVDALQALQPNIESQLAVINSIMTRGKADRDAQIARITDSLDRIQQTQVEMAKSIAALTAVVGRDH